MGKKARVVIDTNVLISAFGWHGKPEVIIKNVIAYPKFNFSWKLPSDNRVIECAVSGNVDFVISGDKRLLNLKAFRGIDILSPDDFLAFIIGE
ncbi:MAG: hypothetical protein HZA01_00595 [Nitrospinae bacterium]|nr:hypothetical protein [Nitrospinota bacterium]